MTPSTADRGAQRALLDRAVRARPGSVLWDAPTSTLLDVFSGKSLPLDWARVAAVEERTDAAGARPYLALRLDSGVEIAVADPGIAFPPATAGTGPLPIQRSTRVVARHSRSKSCCAHVGVADRSTNAMMASVRTSRECCTRRAGCRDAPAAEGK